MGKYTYQKITGLNTKTNKMKLKYLSIKRCPICGSPKIHKILTKRTFLRNFKMEVSQTYAICSECTFMFTANPLSSSNLEKYYTSNTQERKNGADENELSHMRDQINFLKNSLNFSNLVVLEIGANNGSFLAKYGALESYYSEINIEGLSILKKNKNLKDFENVPVKQRVKKLDQIILLHTLEHVVNPKKFVKSLSRYLKNGGIFFIEVPDFTFNDKDTDEFIFEHINFFNEITLKKLFQNAGLTVTASQIALDQKYPACTKYVVRMIAQKATNVFPKKISERISVLKEKEKEREGYFKRLDARLAKLDKKSSIGIYSASWLTTECLEKTKLLDYNIVGIFDRDQKKHGTTIKNIPIKSSDVLLPTKLEHIFVLNEGYENEIRQFFQKIKFPVEKVSWWSDFKK